jgi:mycothiol S-conjugate amidase
MSELTFSHIPVLLQETLDSLQIDPDGMWFAIPREIQQSVWPTEDYELVETTVESTLPEDDLFAGIPTPAP